MNRLAALMTTLITAWLGVLGCLVPASATAAEQIPATVSVFAAASLKNGLDDAVYAWEHRSGKAAVVTYAGSNVLARQIEQGAPADVFISADRDWMTYLSDKGLTRKNSERDWLGNQLVLIAPQASALKLQIAPGFGLAAALGNGRLAICDAAVPAGRYAIAALKSLGVWSSVEQHTAPAENVRATLALVARGEVPLGIVYLTDAHAEPAVRVVGTFADSTHPPIVYPLALLHQPGREMQAGTAQDLVDFLESAAARPYFEQQGFTVLAH